MPAPRGPNQYRGRVISYAQNAEDVVLRRAFEHSYHGFYIDVGAANPVGDSVTKLFYDIGWSGINIEPHPFWIDLLRRERSRDVNLEVAVSSREGVSTLYGSEGRPGGGATLEEPAGCLGEGLAVETVTLSDICGTYVRDRTIDFLKVDVEGHELDVLRGMDLRQWRPRVIVTEVISDLNTAMARAACDTLLTATGYERALFDGVNVFYVSSEGSRALFESLQVPANVLDHYIPYRYLPLLQRVRRVGHLSGVLSRARRRQSR